MAVEKNVVAKLQDPRTIRKIQRIDEHLMCTFSGLQADARVLIDKARFECQSHRFNYEDEPSIHNIAKFIAETQQRHTQRGGMRPFGISVFLCGFDSGKPHLYKTEPSGAYAEWKANAIGKKSKELTEYLENKYADDMDKEQATRLAITTLLEVVEGGKNMEICVISDNKTATLLDSEYVQKIAAEVEAEKEAAEQAKKKV